MLAPGKCFSVLAQGVGLGGFEGGTEEQQQLSPGREARGLLKAPPAQWLQVRISAPPWPVNKSQGRAELFGLPYASAGPSASSIFSSSFLHTLQDLQQGLQEGEFWG